MILLAQLACDRPLHAELSDRDGPATLSYALICRCERAHLPRLRNVQRRASATVPHQPRHEHQAPPDTTGGRPLPNRGRYASLTRSTYGRPSTASLRDRGTFRVRAGHRTARPAHTTREVPDVQELYSGSGPLTPPANQRSIESWRLGRQRCAREPRPAGVGDQQSPFERSASTQGLHRRSATAEPPGEWLSSS